MPISGTRRTTLKEIVIEACLISTFSSVLCAGNHIFLFVGLANVKCQSVRECDLFYWTAIDRVTLNGQRMDSLFPEIDSIYRLTALRDGLNELVLHTKPIAPEHSQVSCLVRWFSCIWEILALLQAVLSGRSWLWFDLSCWLCWLCVCAFCSVLFLSRPRSKGWLHHGRTFSIYLYPLSFWLTLPQRVLSTTWRCLSRPCVVFVAWVHLALFIALFLSPGNSLVSSWCDHSMLASSLWEYLCIALVYCV